MYAGGSVEPVAELLAEDIVWHVPGKSPIVGEEVSWRTVGVYRIEDGRIREVWLVPLDLDRFNRIWDAPEPL